MALDLACNYTHINSNTTTTIMASVNRQTGPLGLLVGIEVNAVGSAWVITIYDNSTGSGTVVGVISGLASAAAFRPPRPIQLTTGLTIVTSGTTPGDITVAWL